MSPHSVSGDQTALHGRDRSNLNYVSDHAGYDWPVQFVPLRAVAAGTVIRAEAYHKIDPGSFCDAPETHVYLQHNVCGVNGYCEKFVSYYTHMSALAVSSGQTVQKGDLIGFREISGCVAPLHYTAARLTNAGNSLEETRKFTDCGLTRKAARSMWPATSSTSVLTLMDGAA
jgi:murein DD-endopeptidase MepM/ murein hydrolase activator NlpD